MSRRSTLHDLVLASESFEGRKGRSEAWKRAMKLRGFRVSVKKTMPISSENVRKVTVKGKFAVCKKGVASNSILSQFCRCWQISK